MPDATSACNTPPASRYSRLMKVILNLALALAFTGDGAAYTTNLISNGSFEAGTNGWILSGGTSKYSLTNRAYQGTTAMLVTNRIIRQRTAAGCHRATRPRHQRLDLGHTPRRAGQRADTGARVARRGGGCFGHAGHESFSPRRTRRARHEPMGAARRRAHDNLERHVEQRALLHRVRREAGSTPVLTRISVQRRSQVDWTWLATAAPRVGPR